MGFYNGSSKYFEGGGWAFIMGQVSILRVVGGLL